ncbi:ABC transporter substrate-binding protein [Neobacillus cucumis]|uniref:ABC transporter substrate-binding protein n=1 Tax=Neobacillus cucumis TaxID=1740721 RepID=UPI002041A596|nr:ABC transporter substrate-binding protein [Neobacillus cucumis]MCM3724870.1 ABC transporter substrate-binding protein [Neobacillus cucumis]
MINKKLLAVPLMATMLFTAAGCTKDQSASTSTNSNKNDKSPVTYTYFNAGAAGKDLNTDETTIGKELEKQTGVNFKVEHIVGDVNTKIGTMIASGKYPDLLVPDTAIDKVVQAGAFIDLTDLIDKYAPNLKKLYGPYLNRMKDPKDGKIYFIPFGASQGYAPYPDIQQSAFWVQRAVLKEAGYPKIKTADEYFKLIEDYQKKHPTVDGAKTIGFTALTYDWRFSTLSGTPARLAGSPNDGGVIVDMNTHKSSVYGNKDITKNYLKMLNELNNKGLFDKEAFVSNYDEYLAKIASGRVLGFYDYQWQISQSLNNLKQAGNDDKQYMALPITFDDSIKDQYIDPPTFVNNRGVGITVSAKDPVRIIKYLDALCKEENQKLVEWGIKGQTYEVDSKGRYYRTQEEIAKTSDQAFNDKFGFTTFDWYWPVGDGLYSDGNAWLPGKQPEVAIASYTDGDKKLLQAYGIKVFSDLFAKPDDRPWYPTWSAQIPQGSPAQIFDQRSTDLEKKYFPKLVLSSPSQFNSIWNEYVKQYNALDVKAYESTMDKVVKDRIEQAKQK